MTALRTALALAGAAFICSLPVHAAPPPVSLRLIVGDLQFPVEIGHANDGSQRLFIVEQAGRIRIVKNGALVPTPFLDITSLALFDFGERGLLGLAFHPQYAANRRFYVFYTREGDGALQVSEFLASAADPDVADTAERPLLTIPHSFAGNHNGGRIAFGPDGYLYIGTGDGGGGGDPENNAENIQSLLGKLLRIDVNWDAFPADATRNYAIPSTNPFVGVAGADEIWAYGLRNPWKFAFDRLTGDLFIADVGQNTKEEVNFQPAGSAGGRNYGWDEWEGTFCFEPQDPACAPTGKVFPILEIEHGDGGAAIIGGYVYRGSRSHGLRGFYIYGDLAITEMFAASPNGAGTWSNFVLGDGPGSITAFGEDEAGELYVVNYSNGTLHAIDGPNDRLTRFDLNADGYADVLWRNSQSGENYA
jgi:glucose/arabinose dehydrogenase